MYPHADDKWICPYIHLVIHTFELQLQTGLVLCKPPRILVILTLANKGRNKHPFHLTRKTLCSSSELYLFLCFDLFISLFAQAYVKPLWRAPHLFLLALALLETSSSFSSASVDRVEEGEEPWYATPQLKLCKKFGQSEEGNAGWGGSAGLLAVEVRDASECQRRCAEAGKCYHW